MADELKNLRPEVLDALADVQGEADCRCSEPYKSRGLKDPQCNHDLQDSVDVIRAELLRLAQDNHDLIESLRASEPINREWRERAEKAEGCTTDAARWRQLCLRLDEDSLPKVTIHDWIDDALNLGSGALCRGIDDDIAAMSQHEDK